MQQAGIVGAGAGGTAILNTLLHTPEVKIIGIADIDLEKEGIRLARKYGILTTKNFEDLLKIPGEKIIIDATGVPRIAERLSSINDTSTTVVKPAVALLLMQIVEQREALNRNLAQESTNLISSIENSVAQLEVLNRSNGDTLATAVNRVKRLAKTSQEGQALLEQTDEILKLIRSVAGRTKMLGLNATIEAARAGEYGRGFSVVAENIHQLAASSATSANDVAKTVHQIHEALITIGDSVQRVVEEINLLETEHNKLTTELQHSLDEMHKSARKLQDMAKIAKE